MASLVAGDLSIAAGSLLAVVLVRRRVDLSFTRSVLPAENFPLTLFNFAIFAGTLIVALALAGFYDLRVAHRSRSAAGFAGVIQVAILATVWTLLDLQLPRTIVVGALLFEIPGILLWRRLLASGRKDLPSLVIVGSAQGIRSFLDHFDGAGKTRPEIQATVAASPPAVEGIAWWGSLETPGVAERLAAAEEVLFVSGDDVADQRLRLFAARGARGFLLLPSAADAILMSSSFGWIGDQPLLEISVPSGYGVAGLIKRSFDLLAGTLGVFLTAPIWMAAAIAIALEDGRPVLIRQPRVGRAGATFRMWKFRTMRSGQNGDPLRLSDLHDPRVTRVGRILRRYRVDELPQLLNVLSGEMSLVGPRPEQPAIAAQITLALPEFELRTLVRPGIAGLAQVSADYHTQAAVKLRYDLAYMRDWSFFLDLRILLQTVTTVLSGRGI